MRASTFSLILLTTACVPAAGDDGGSNHDTEIISRVELTFTPADGGPAIVAAFSDPDGDGGVSGQAEPISLSAATSYSLRIGLVNDLVDPAVDIAEEVEAEAEQHMLFVADDGMLLSIAYADLESDYGANEDGEDLPLGLVHDVGVVAGGTANLRVILRHLPPLNGSPQKTAALPGLFADGEPLPGDVDVDVSFALTVQ